MKALAAGAVLVALTACRIQTPPPEGGGGSSGAGNSKPLLAIGVDRGGRFFSRDREGREGDLSLRQLSVQVAVRPGTVRSHLRMEVASPIAGQSEAVIRLRVPAGAAVTKAVLWVNGQPQNGAFVERRQASDIYRSIVQKRRDPALVTWDGPDFVAVSIFPLDRAVPRTFELEWVEPAGSADGEVQYRVPTIVERGLVVGRAALEVEGHPVAVGERDVLSIASSGGSDVVMARAPGSPFQQVFVRTAATSAPPRVVLVAETSAAMTLTDRRRARAEIDGLLGALPPGSKVTIVAADWDATALVEDAGPSECAAALATLDGIPSAGALHLERALLFAAARARVTQATGVLFVGRGQDGFAGDPLRAPLEALLAGDLRLSVIAPDEIPPALSSAVAQTGGETLSSARPAGELSGLIGALRPRPVRPALPGARALDDWRPLPTITGQTVWMGRALGIPAAAGAVDGGTGTVASVAAEAELTPLWERAHLSWRGRDDAAVASVAPASVLTPTRALLVLETAADYGRLGLIAPDPIDRGPPKGEGTIGLGKLATIGETTAGASGASSGRGTGGLGGKRARAPEVLPGQATVRGSLDRELIRRIVRRNVNDVRFCYEQELVRRPALEGRLAVQFTIEASGRVRNSALQSSTLDDAYLENCFVAAIRRWEFPKPLGGGMVTVSYPFSLSPAGVDLWALARRTDPRAEIHEALAILAGDGLLSKRVLRISMMLGFGVTPDAESVGWLVPNRSGGLEPLTLVARLLAVAGRRHDAIRVLSEGAGSMPNAIAAELRRMGAEADARAVRALAARRP